MPNKLLVYFLIFPAILLSLPDKDTNWKYFKENFYGKPYYVVNRPIVKFNFGLDNVDYNLLPSEVDFKNTYSLNFHYGFIRIDDDTDEDPNIFRHTHEYVFLENISSTFKNFDNTSIGQNTDTWGFGFGLEDGFGIRNENNRVYLLHSSGFSWTHIDFDIAGIKTDENFKTLRPYNDKLRFGMFYGGGWRYEFFRNFSVDLKYRKNLIHPEFEFDKFLYSYIFDNISQRWIDYFEPDFMDIFGDNYIWMKFIYKNAVSFIMYKMRESSSYYPFGGNNVFYYDSFKIGLVFIF